MKKIFTVCIVLLSLLLCLACSDTQTTEGNQNEDTETTVKAQQSKFTPDITIEEIDWDMGIGTINGENYVLFEYTNNSKFTITLLEINFTEKKNVSDTQKEAFYSDIKKSQNFDDEWMSQWIESRNQQGKPLTMYAKCNEEIASGNSANKIKCYYIGGWGSKNVLHNDIFEAEKMTIEYISNSEKKTLYYNFSSNMYDLATE